ncbi:MAG: hypothetical protein WC718_13385 [Phycisphaerales bacterium]
METSSVVSVKDGHLRTRRTILGYELEITDTYGVPWLLPHERSQHRIELYTPSSYGFTFRHGVTRVGYLLRGWGEIDRATPITDRTAYFQGTELILDSVGSQHRLNFEERENRVELIDEHGKQVFVTDVSVPKS